MNVLRGDSDALEKELDLLYRKLATNQRPLPRWVKRALIDSLWGRTTEPPEKSTTPTNETT